jgi:hypothetical protein
MGDANLNVVSNGPALTLSVFDGRDRPLSIVPFDRDPQAMKFIPRDVAF